jgi:hypothetical protein
LTITAVPVTLSSLTLNPTTVIGGKDSTGTITLNEAAPAGGVKVSLSSDLFFFVSVPSSVTVPAGAKSATFNISTEWFFLQYQATISASYNSVSKNATLTVIPFEL